MHFEKSKHFFLWSGMESFHIGGHHTLQITGEYGIPFISRLKFTSLLGMFIKEKKVWLDAITKQAEFGYEDAQLTLGKYYLERYDFDEDEEAKERGIYWLKKRANLIISKMTEAAEQGDVNAMFDLAQGGRGYSEDNFTFAHSELGLNDIVYWYLIAAQEGHAEAQYILSRYYSNGWYFHYDFSDLRWSVIPFCAQDEDGDFDEDMFEEAVGSVYYFGWIDTGELLGACAKSIFEKI